MYHAIKRDGTHFVFPALSSNKDTGVALARAAFELFDVVRYIFINEAWVLDARRRGMTAAESERIDREGISTHPDRIEVVMFAAEDETEGMLMARRCILRPEHGKPKLTALEYMPDSGRFQGRMVGLLPRHSREKSQ